jgi:hypothetical protein
VPLVKLGVPTAPVTTKQELYVKIPVAKAVFHSERGAKAPRLVLGGHGGGACWRRQKCHQIDRNGNGNTGRDRANENIGRLGVESLRKSCQGHETGVGSTSGDSFCRGGDGTQKNRNNTYEPHRIRV